ASPRIPVSVHTPIVRAGQRIVETPSKLAAWRRASTLESGQFSSSAEQPSASQGWGSEQADKSPGKFGGVCEVAGAVDRGRGGAYISVAIWGVSPIAQW